MNRFFLPRILLFLCALSLCAVPAWAAPPEKDGQPEQKRRVIVVQERPSPGEKNRPQNRSQNGRQLSPEEREHLRQQMREAWKSLPPEARKVYKDTHQEYRIRIKQCQEKQDKSQECFRWEHLYYFQNATPEERERLRELLRHHYQSDSRPDRPERRPEHKSDHAREHGAMDNRPPPEK